MSQSLKEAISNRLVTLDSLVSTLTAHEPIAVCHLSSSVYSLLSHTPQASDILN